jgi:hypothetical protein
MAELYSLHWVLEGIGRYWKAMEDPEVIKTERKSAQKAAYSLSVFFLRSIF